MSVTPNPDQHVAQLIDANLDRAREGLRVIEDWCRFSLKNKDMVITLKNWRQQLGKEHYEIYKNARSSSSDQSAGLSHPAQKERILPQQILSANFARIQEALRVIEEFSRISHPKLSKISAQIRYEIYDLEVIILKISNLNMLDEKLKSCKLCLITRTHPELIKTVLLALKAGVTMIQYRCKETPDNQMIAEAKELASICKSYNSLFLINDRADIALAVDADGVHLGQKDMPIQTARKIIGHQKIIGLSTHSLEEIQNATSQGCNYIGIGPIFKTKSKQNDLSLGIDFFSKINLKTNLPWFAIGGINKDNIDKIKEVGIKRVAVINAIMGAEDPYLASKELLGKLKK
ncbi:MULTISPECIES: thiamine phosphate synthase [Prochlorococcus]|uniref:Thiamine-phosphate synthase n=1 Tax=Prochlorococcus marinus (strain SARG / CCMP1375 / SS120) TaxID=167539 RepID=THIE_PROMA|nr:MULTISPECIES: thiamine phosphate synthase [Prochlorococcus]Q7VAV5.1 RecName: Full=Thiamine-phosphate synthase; Short=TP synthase; Short=TPS; AltName: Full=Thiamine-phosphate pyrophosphorylase; Short=TMP pyrophosphorylase; Short=TMP-PPase [Prochlorococcus marinus subsp. marinus str. CCMP1375]AAQ00392.1 Thiamine monophosphate synthase [Prochlorococcus marinus subsp. marinus str. CCMP1375]KGG14273.1 Thiamin-phosphate pyrophosphorylase [Prochlorococcus marinus str. LG]KGG22154.1 Thiamin-phosphat